MSILWRGRGLPGPNGTAFSVSRELTRLDPFSFFLISGVRYGADHVVVGSTGTFVIRVVASNTGLRPEVTRARRAARRARREIGPAGVHSPVYALLCVPGRQADPIVKRGVRVVPWGSVVSEISARSRTVTRHQAQRVAERLGAPAFRQARADSA